MGTDLPQDPVTPFWGIYPKDSLPYHKILAQPCSLLLYSEYPEIGNNLDISHQKNEWRKRGTFTQWSITQPLENDVMKFARKYMELGKNHPEGGNPDPER